MRRRWLLLAAAAWAAFLLAGRTALAGDLVTLRYADELPEQAVNAAAEYVDPDGITVSFVGEKRRTVTAAGGTRRAEGVRAVGYKGNAMDCLPMEYSAGTAPGAGDGYGCAVSSELAWRLFGSTEAVGGVLTLEGKNYGVTGIFEAAEAILLYPARDHFTCAVLRGVPDGDPYTAALRFAAASGLGTPQETSASGQKQWIMGALCWLPLLLTGAVLLAAALRASPHRRLLCFLLALGIAALLPAALAALPGWLLPARWSDFSFWPDLFAQLKSAWKAPLCFFAFTAGFLPGYAVQ